MQNLVQNLGFLEFHLIQICVLLQQEHYIYDILLTNAQLTFFMYIYLRFPLRRQRTRNDSYIILKIRCLSYSDVMHYRMKTILQIRDD
jgi:hypothetical protein